MTWEFGVYLKEILHKKRWKQRDLAQKSGISETYISIILRGRDPKTEVPPNISRQNLLKIALALGMPFEELNAVYSKEVPELPRSKEESQHYFNDYLKRLVDEYPDPDELKEKLREALESAEDEKLKQVARAIFQEN